ncbi:MAG: type I DNA topoisomerase [Planctomycetota bacterium]|nr:MAG: type I DNA topoisomerase [Planctomycetota bacterium]
MRLVIVESPNKIRKIKGFLGPDTEVVASFGHVADLPASGDLAVQFCDGQVLPQYQPLERAGKAIAALKRAARQAQDILLATDPDREGEAIAWHVARILGPNHRYQRVVFQSITAEAVRQAVNEPRSLNQNLVDAQQARRVLDRVVGWIVSPTLRQGTRDRQARSAGRVQSAALRLVVERERAIAAHASTTYYTLDAQVSLGQTQSEASPITVRLIRWKGEDLGHRLHSRQLAQAAADWCLRQSWQVQQRQQRQQRRRAPPPFTTATVQQAASVRLRMNPKRTMATLQKLFEDGLITYHRTDSVSLAPEAIAAARTIIKERFGPEMVPQQANIYSTKSANSQEAHEAIRPTTPQRGPDAAGSSGDTGALYRLIWERFIACQMIDGIDQITTLDVAVAPDSWRMEDGSRAPMGIFQAKAVRVRQAGWRSLGEDSTEESTKKKKRSSSDGDEAAASARSIPACAEGDPVHCHDIATVERSTKAPARYTQASLIKRLEKEGIGRPSTYAAIMNTILERGYVEERRRKLHATETGCTVTDYLMQHFAGDFIDLSYTARLEGALDAIARGESNWHKVVSYAAFAVRDAARRAGLAYDPLDQQAAQAARTAAHPCPLCGKEMHLRNGRYGPFYGCSVRSCRGTTSLDGSPSRATAAILQQRSGKDQPPPSNG